MECAEQTVVVTGGTRGIGRAISLRFAAAGARVTAAYLANEQAAEELEVAAASLPGTITTIKADVSTGAGAIAVIDAAAGPSGHLDVLINNAGIIRDVYLPMMAEEDWETVLRTNVSPLFHCCKWGVRKMLAKRRGAIVNVASISAYAGTPGQTNYAASKGAAISFTKALSREVGPMGIRVNAVAPGLIETEMIAGMKQEIVQSIVKSTALGRLGQAAEVAEAVLFLASDRASYISGQCLIVDGGII